MHADAISRTVPVPHCLHGQLWNQCVLCARTTWCEDCGDRVVLDAGADPTESDTCPCVDRMISVPAVTESGHRGQH